jgi:hypothetical protein
LGSYEQAIAVADSLIAWTYGVAGVGLIIDASWAYAWAWLPGAILTYHALQFWFWTANHRRSGDGYSTTRNPMRTVWAVANLGTGVLTLFVANSQMLVP